MPWVILIISGILEAVWATALGRTEGFTRPWPKKIAMSEQASKRAEELWQKISKGWKP